MGISRINSLFASNADSLRQQRTGATRTVRTQVQKTGVSMESTTNRPASEAVVISDTLKASLMSSFEDAEPARVDRVRQLKQQVQSGTYIYDSEKVALSVVRELA